MEMKVYCYRMEEEIRMEALSLLRTLKEHNLIHKSVTLSECIRDIVKAWVDHHRGKLKYNKEGKELEDLQFNNILETIDEKNKKVLMKRLAYALGV